MRRTAIAVTAGACVGFGLATIAGADWFACLSGLALAGLMFICIEV